MDLRYFEVISRVDFCMYRSEVSTFRLDPSFSRLGFLCNSVTAKTVDLEILCKYAFQFYILPPLGENGYHR